MEVKLYESVDLLGFCCYSKWEQVVSLRGFIGEKYFFSKIFSFKFLCLHRPSISHLLFFKRFILIWKSPSVRNLHSHIFMHWQLDLIMFLLFPQQSILCPLLFCLAKANCGLLSFCSRLLWSCFLERLHRNGFRSIPINRWMYKQIPHLITLYMCVRKPSVLLLFPFLVNTHSMYKWVGQRCFVLRAMMYNELN